MSTLPPDYTAFGFADPTSEFVMITAMENGERALVEGVIVIPGLPVCRVRLKTDTDRLYRYGPGRRALVEYVRAALCEDAADALPHN